MHGAIDKSCFLSPVLNEAGRYATNDFIAPDRPGDHGTRRDHRPIADVNTRQDYRIHTDPDVISDLNFGRDTRLLKHRNAQHHSMVMIGDVDSRGNQTAASDTYAVADFKLNAAPEEGIGSDIQARSAAPDTKPDIILQNTPMSEIGQPRPVDSDTAPEQTFRVYAAPAGQPVSMDP